MKSLILVCGDLKVRKLFILAVLLLDVIFTQKLDDIVLAAKFGSSNDSRNQTTQVVDKLIGSIWIMKLKVHFKLQIEH
jgi:hypothetical protein